MTPARCTRLGLPTGGDVIRAWVEPLAWWGARLRAAIAVARPGNVWARGRVRRLEIQEAAARGVSVTRLREMARERLAMAVEAQGKDPL